MIDADAVVRTGTPSQIADIIRGNISLTEAVILLDAFAAQEREACAEECDNFVMDAEPNMDSIFELGADWAAKELAKKLRARTPALGCDCPPPYHHPACPNKAPRS